MLRNMGYFLYNIHLPFQFNPKFLLYRINNYCRKIKNFFSGGISGGIDDDQRL